MTGTATEAPARELSGIHREYLTSHAVDLDNPGIAAAGIYSDGPCIVIPWRDGKRVTLQRRPWPGGPGEYYWESETKLHLNILRDPSPEATVLLCEGTKQSLAVASWAPPEYAVMGMPGCYGWVTKGDLDLSRFAGRRVLVMLDADAAGNLDVWEAGERLASELDMEDATALFIPSPAWGKDGIDDYLARFSADKRTDRLARLIERVQDKPADKKPTKRKQKAEEQQPETAGRPMIVVNRDRMLVISEILGVMQQRWGGKELFCFGGVLARLRGDRAEPLDKDAFAAWLAEGMFTCRYRKPTQTAPGDYEPEWPDFQTMGAVLSLADRFAPLHRIARVPFFRPDGTACFKNGYDWETGTFLACGNSGMDRLDIPDEPTAADAAAAARYLTGEWLGNMPFRDVSSRASALALVLTPFIRGLVPLVPLAVVSGLQPGVGKGLLGDCISTLATGQAQPPLPYVTDDEDEIRKQITAAFRQGTDLFCFDEAHELKGAALSRALTSITYTDRILGVSKMAEFPNQVTWMSLGNNVEVNADMARRVHWIELYPEGPDPDTRPESAFAHPDLRTWTKENRPELVTAALIVIRAWFAAGRPAYHRGSLMGSFETWDKMMSGILAYAGVPGFLEGLAVKRGEADFTGSMWGDHISWLYRVFGTEEFTAGEVKTKAQAASGHWDAPPDLDDVMRTGYARELGRAYSKVGPRWFSGLRLVKVGRGHNNTTQWVIQPIEGVNDLDTHPDLGGGNQGGSNSGTSPVPGNRGVQENNMPSDLGVSKANIPSPARGEWGDRGESYNPSRTRTPARDAPAHDARSRAHATPGNYPPVSPDSPRASSQVRGFSPAPSQVSVGVPLVKPPVALNLLGIDLETADAGELFLRPRDAERSFVRLAGAIGPGGQTVITDGASLTALLPAAGEVAGHNILGFDGLALAWHHGLDWEAFAARARDTEIIARQWQPPRSRETHSEDKLDLDSVAAMLGLPGKGHPHGTGVLTPEGFVPVEKLVPGDLVTGSDGQPVKVLDTYRRGVLPVYRVTFSDGSSVRVDGDHRWAARTSAMEQGGGAYRAVETRELSRVLHRRWEIPQVSGPVEMAERDLPVDPYILGVLLGDGTFTQARASFTPGDARVPAEVARRLPDGLVLSKDPGKQGKADTWRIITAGSRRGRLPGGDYARNPVVLALENLGLAGKAAAGKFIPDGYLYASVNQRLDLLRGLMDTDGELHRHRGSPETAFSSSSEKLCDQVRFLVESFGGTACKTVKQAPGYSYRGECRTGQPSYRLSINTPVNPFLTRDGWEPASRRKPKRIINSIDPDGEAEVTCLRVNAADSLYVTEHCIVTHNTDDIRRLKREHGGWDAIPLDDPEYRAYLEGDLRATLAVAGRLHHDDYTRREHELASLAGRMSLNGFAVDRALLDQRLAEGGQRKRQALHVLHEGWGLPLGKMISRGRGSARHEEFEEAISPLSTDYGRAWLESMWSRYQIPDPPRTAKTGKLALGSDELASVASDPRCPPDLRAMISLMDIVTGTRTVYQNAVKNLAPDGRVHPRISMRQSSGRWSTTDPGLTVFGKHEGRHVERDIFIADEGHVLFSCDLSQVDMRGIAGLCQDPAYMALFADASRDAHAEIAAQVFGDPHNGHCPKGCQLRQNAKARGHGWNYGLGAKRMIDEGADPDLVYRFVSGMEARFPVLCSERDQWRAAAAAGAILDNGFGRRMRADPQRAYTVAPALMGQGSAGDIMKEVLRRLDTRAPELRPYYRVMVHDEQVFSVPEKDAADIIQTVREAFTWEFRGVPITCDVNGPGRSWGDISS